MYRFNARYTHYEDDGESITIGFADDELEPERWVLLTRSHHVTPNEREFGYDALYIEVEDQVRSMYGGIRSVEILDDVLRLNLDATAEVRLRIESHIEIQLEHEPPEFPAILETLSAIAGVEGFEFVM